jgi:hypothetical protein
VSPLRGVSFQRWGAGRGEGCARALIGGGSTAADCWNALTRSAPDGAGQRSQGAELGVAVPRWDAASSLLGAYGAQSSDSNRRDVVCDGWGGSLGKVLQGACQGLRGLRAKQGTRWSRKG